MEVPVELERIIYLDNAATVYPKPAEPMAKALELYQRVGVNPGRSGFDLGQVGADFLFKGREVLTSFFGGTDPERLCFNYNASEALNILIQGLVKQGDHVVTTVLEHNSVIRPINHLAREGVISVDYVPCDADCRVDPAAIESHLRENTTLCVVNHGSNVLGVVQPVAEIGALCRERGVRLVIDVAQTAGVVPIDVEAMKVDALAFTGHKSLLGPAGIGGLYVRPGVEVGQTRAGGTGVKSAYPYHLEEYPFRLEVGTPNLLGVLALILAHEWIVERGGVEAIHAGEMQLFERLQAGLAGIEGITLHGTTSLEHRLPVLSFTIDGQDAADTGTLLDVDHDVATRTGLHCAPLIHAHMGTSPRGTVRMSIGPSNTVEEVEAAIVAVAEIAADFSVLKR